MRKECFLKWTPKLSFRKHVAKLYIVQDLSMLPQKHRLSRVILSIWTFTALILFRQVTNWLDYFQLCSHPSVLFHSIVIQEDMHSFAMILYIELLYIVTLIVAALRTKIIDGRTRAYNKILFFP